MLRVRPLARFELAQQVRWNLPASIRKALRQAVTFQAFEPPDICCDALGRGRLTIARGCLPQSLQLALVAVGIVDAAISARELRHDPIGRLHPGLDFDADADCVLLLQQPRQLGRHAHVVAAPIGRLDSGEHLPAQLVMKANSDDHPLRDRRRIFRTEDLISRSFIADEGPKAAARLDVLAALNEKLFPAVGQTPGAGRFLRSELHFLERLQPVQARQALAFWGGQQPRQSDRTVRRRMLGERAINFRESLAADLDGPPRGHVSFAASAELAREDFLRPPAHAVGQILAVDSELIAVPVHPAHDDVNVRIVAVPVGPKPNLEILGCGENVSAPVSKLGRAGAYVRRPQQQLS